MDDYLVRATAANGQVRAFACTTKKLTEEARNIHCLTPVTTAALGRLMAGGLMMGAMMKGDRDLLTLRIEGAGPAVGALVTADSKGNIKGYVNRNDVMLPLRPDGKLDVGGAFGPGFLSVIKDMGLKDPYVGQTMLVSGEIAEDLTYYFANSEQVPSTVGLGVLVNGDCTVKQAGGFIVQLMPFASEEVISSLENKLKSIDSVTAMLDAGKSPEDILLELLGDQELVINDTMPVKYNCDCNRERFTRGLISLGRREIQEMIDEGKPIEVNCHFCDKKYEFGIDELKDIFAAARR
ncbi:MAG: Hsp33 family molecular chaperone HslO [Lachnospiraceae bacterium]|nr:Hsp33 family molecular chaperone HslO [Lachnospiraceae bacterium]